jgi:imidazolonepropionase-like amidohydrolase
MPEMAETDDPAFNRFDEPLDIGERIKRLAHMWTHADENKMGELIELMVQRRVFWVPTLVMFRQLGGIYDESIRQSESLGSVPEGYLQRWQHDERYATWGEDEYRALQKALAAIQTFTRRFHEAGGAVITGTDNPNPYTVPGPSLHQELELLVEAGLSPMQALQSATSRAARFLGRRASDIGEIAPGKVADCVVLDSDPLADIRHTRQIAMVIKGGQIIDHEHLIQA